MSAIFGIFNRDGSPVNPQYLEKMAEAMSFIRAEKKETRIIDNAGFGYFLTYNTPEAVNEAMPKWLPEQNLLFMAKGRIDNRKELIELLGVPSSEKENIPDGELMLRAYLKFGNKVMDRLLGDWALAAFHTDRQELFLARDHHGYTAIDYYIDDKVIAFSSSTKSLLSLDFVPKRLHEENLLRILVVWPGESQNLMYHDIFILPPAHTLTVRKDSYKAERYWFPENIAENSNRSLEDTVSQFSEILYTAVKDRLRSYRPVASMLSGGLDSGTVSYIAAALKKQEGEKLTTYSHVPLYEPSKILHQANFGDERPYILSTAEASGNIKPVFLDSKEISPIDGILKLMEILQSPIHAALNAYWLVDLPETAGKDGFGTLLSGEHGNATISFTGVDYLLPFSFLKQNMGLKRAIKKKILRPLALNYSGGLYKRLKYSAKPFDNHSYISPDYAEKIKLAEKMKAEYFDPTFNFEFKRSQEMSLKILQPGANMRCLFGGVLSDYFNIEWRDPTADKRVVEYMLTIPNKMFFDNKGEPKNIIKVMMKDKMPDKVLYSKTKGRQSADIGMRLSHETDRMEEFIRDSFKSEKAREMIDTKRVWQDWKSFKAVKNNEYEVVKIHHLLRTVSAAYFMNSFDLN